MLNDQAVPVTLPSEDHTIILNLVWFSILVFCSFLSCRAMVKAGKEMQIEKESSFFLLSAFFQAMAYAALFDVIPQPFHFWLEASLPQAGQTIHFITLWAISLSCAFIWVFSLPVLSLVFIENRHRQPVEFR